MEDIKEQIRSAYEHGEGSFKELADKYNVKLGTIKSWAKRDKDNGNKWFKVATSTKKQKKAVAKQNKEVAQEKEEGKIENKVIDKAVEKVLENKELNDKQKLFCMYYIKCFNATKAYQKAYGCDYMSATANGPRLIGNDRIRAEIQRLKADKFKGAMLSIQDLLQKYIDIALSDMNDFMEYGHKKIPVIDKKTGEQKLDQDGNPRYYIDNYVILNDSSKVDGTLVTEVSEGKDGIKLKLMDKKFALEFLAKYQGLLDKPTQAKLDIERRKMELAEKSADTLDDDIEYAVEGGTDEDKKED